MNRTDTPAQTIRCGACKGRHATPYDVEQCYVARDLIQSAFVCDWQVPHSQRCTVPLSEPCGMCEDGGYMTVDCGAIARIRPDGSGWDCDRGHEHTTMEARQRQGWDYASDQGEAEQLARYGTEPREMADAKVWAW